MEKEILFYIGIALVVGFVIGYFVFGVPGTTGQASLSCPSYSCEFIDRNASWDSVGAQSCSGEKGILLGTTECKIQIKNTEPDQSAKYTALFNCKTIDTEMIKSSNEVTLAPGQTGDFKIDFTEAGHLNWKCQVTNVESSTVKSCELRQK